MAGQSAAGAAVAWAFLGNSIKKLLEPGEELVAFDDLRRRTPLNSIWVASYEITPDGLDLPKRIATAATPTRFVVMSAGGAMTAAKEIVLEVPLGQISGVEQEKHVNLDIYRWNAHGYDWTVRSSRARGGSMARALGLADWTRGRVAPELLEPVEAASVRGEDVDHAVEVVHQDPARLGQSFHTPRQ